MRPKVHYEGALRAEPLEPTGLVAWGEVAAALRALFVREPERLEGLRGVANDDVFVVLGRAARLPWLDGARYIAEDSGSGLYTSTTHAITIDGVSNADVARELVHAALVEAHGLASLPLVVLESGVVSLRHAAPIALERLGGARS